MFALVSIPYMVSGTSPNTIPTTYSVISITLNFAIIICLGFIGKGNTYSISLEK